MSDFINILNTIKLFFLSLFETGKQEKEKFLKLSLTMLSTIIILILINFVIYSIYPDNSEALKIQAKEIIMPSYHLLVWPEPIEQLQFLISLISIPPLMFCSIRIFSSKFLSKISITNSMHFLNVVLSFSFLVILFYLAFKFDDPNSISRAYLEIIKECNCSFIFDIRVTYKAMTTELRFLLTLIFFPVITYYIFNGLPKKYKKIINWVFYSLILFFLLSMFLLSICNRDNYLGNYVHFNSVLYSIAQVQQGKALLADFTAQYGLYAHFLYPFFKLINVNVISFSMTMSAITLASFSLIFFGLRKIISNNVVVFFTFLAIIYFGYFYYLFNGDFDFYYQYKSIRMIFPAIILFSVFTYILNPKKILYLLIIFISSLSILWNFDSGIICFLSFYIYILYERLPGSNLRSFAKEFIKHTIISVTILSFTFFLFSIIIYLQSNSLPNWSLFLKFSILFGMTGFSSLPMPIFHTWNLVFLVYLYGIYVGLNSILLNKKIILDRVAFFVAIFGFGVASYYLNRSHDFHFFQTLYPSIILLGIFLSKILDRSNRDNLFKIKNFLMVIIISFILVTIFFQMLQPIKIINTLTPRIPDIINNKLTDQSVSDGVALINSNSKPNDQVVIISNQDSVAFLETKTSSAFSLPGSSEMVVKSDWDIFNNSLLNNNSFKVYLSDTHDPKSKYVKILKDHYYLDDWFGRWRMFVPKKAPISQPGIKATASYSLFCPNNAKNCNSAVKNFLPVENLPKNNKYIKVDFNLSEPITLQSILLNIIIDSHYAGTVTTLPVEGIWNIGILDHNNKQFVNTDARLEHLDYEVKESFSVLISDYSNYIKTCEPFNIELIYNDNQKLKVRASCK
tara:strand:+ start:131 stop:2686 length:2556 start_codon:yes stop_codon:yes gene_type:complete